MADDQTISQQPPTAPQRKFAIPVERAMPKFRLSNGKQFNLPVETVHTQQFTVPVDNQTGPSPTMAVENPKGLRKAGNIPIWNRPAVQNPDGTHSSEFSISIGTDKGEVLIPTVINGRFPTPDGKIRYKGQPGYDEMVKKAIEHYKKTGENLGIFDNAADADAYSQTLHNRGDGEGQKTKDWGSIEPYNPTWWQRTKNVFGTRGAMGAFQQFARAHETTGDLTSALQQFVQAPLASFEELFPANPKTKTGQFAKGGARTLSGFTTPGQLAIIAAPAAKLVEGLEAIPAIFHAVGTAMMPSMAIGVYDSAKQIHDARQSGDKDAETEAYGELVTNIASVVIPHFGGKVAEHFSDSTARLNESAKVLYQGKFSSLTDEQKAHVLYHAIEEASPKFRQRVQQELDRIRDKRKRTTPLTNTRQSIGGVETPFHNVTVEPGAIASQVGTQEAQDRLNAAKTVVNRIVARRAREQAYKVEQAKQEAEARKRQYDAEKAADQPPSEGTSIEKERGFPVEESRITANLPNRGVALTTEREGQMFNPEPEPKPTPVEDRRFWIGDRELIPTRAAEAEKPVQQFAEERMGISFSELPATRQRVVERYFERFQPEQWRAFQSTPAYAEYHNRQQALAAGDAAWKLYLDRHDSGEQMPLAPSADLHAGLSRLILDRTDIEKSLKADPATYRDLNESTEKNMGQSFDSLAPEDKVSALGEYLREKPEKMQAFLTPDLSSRIQSGQHIDLANMADELANRQQAEILMAHRDFIQREMDASAGQQMVREARNGHDSELAEVMRKAPTVESGAFERVDEAARGLTRMAERLNLGPVGSFEDVFRIEQQARELPRGLRTPEMEQFLTRVRQARVAAEDQILRELAEKAAAQVREDRDTGTRGAIREIVRLSTLAEDLHRVSDALRDGHPAEAETVRETANFDERKADAVAAGAETVLKPAPEVPAARPNIPQSVGRETRVVSPGNKEGRRAHYALMDATDVQTSHLPLSYEKRPGYNQKGQPRDYAENRPAQAGIESDAGALDTDILLGTGVTTMEGPPVLDQRAHTIAGNGRMLRILTAVLRNPEQYAKYLRDLKDRIAGFGIDPNDIAKYKNPVIVKVLDAPIESDAEWAMLGKELNESTAYGMSDTEQGTAMANMLSPEYVQRLANIVDSLPLVDNEGRALTVREAMRKKSVEIAKLMQDAGVISANKTKEFITDEGELNDKSKALFENMLAGLTVTDGSVLARANESAKDKLARAGLFFIRMKNAGEDWYLASMNTNALDLLTRAQNRAAELRRLEAIDETTDHSLVDRMLHPEKYRLSNFEMQFDDQPLHGPVHPGVEALARALEEPPKTYTTKIARYADAADGVQNSMFGAEHPAYVFNREIGKDFGITVDPAEWGMVTGLPEEVKAGLEEGREPLPVAPEVHAETVENDVNPDSSSVTDNLKSSPRTVADLEKAIANHQGFDQEKAEALTAFFKEILPRVTGYSAEETLANRRLNYQLGGKSSDEKSRADFEVAEDGSAIIKLCDSADPSTFIHELAHYLRLYMRPEDQGIANKFVGAKPGEEWSEVQEEKFAQAFERYHYDGGIRRGKLEKVFAKLNRWMQSIYNSVTAAKLAKGTPELSAMFDKWYDWERSERKPVTARLDVKALEDIANGQVRIPDDAKQIARRGSPSDSARAFIFLGKDEAQAFLANRKNGVRGWEMYQVKGEDAVYVKADVKNKKLHQPALNDSITLAKQARDLEQQIKRTSDPREQARLRGLLNGIEDKLRGSTLIIGGKAEPPDTSATQLIYGLGEQPSVAEPTTPAQAATTQQVRGDPTAVELGGPSEKRKGRTTDETAGERPRAVEGVPEPEVPANREHGGAAIAKPAKNPLATVKAAKLKGPERERGTPVVDPDVWRRQVEELGLPEGTPPPTIRISPEMRELMIYPGQSEAIEGTLSALQQYDATILAAPTGSGKCLAKGTPVLMFDGTIKLVEDVVVGDKLMGPDSQPRNVLGLAHGEEEMFKVTPVKGEPYTVNRSHILSLKISYDGKSKTHFGGDVENISIEEWLTSSKWFKHVRKGWRTGVEFEPQDVPLPPYLLGIWLGDGSLGRAEVSKPDPEIRDYMHWIAAEYGMQVSTGYGSSGCPTYSVVGKKGRANPLWEKFKALGLRNNKRVPQIYKRNSAFIRREVLAGIIDTDGHVAHGGCEITLKEKPLADDVAFLARSLGLAAYTEECQKTCANNGVAGTYHRTYISGDLSQLPMRLPRKKATKREQKKNVLVTGIEVESVGIGEYFGFEIDGDRLFMLGDFTVTHNTPMLTVVANELLGTGGDKVGLVITRSQNLIHEADGYIEWGRKIGVQIDALPSDLNEIQSGGAYAGTYAQIRGARDVFSIPWDFVIFDESAEARNWTDSNQGKAVVMLGHAAKKVVYASATPYHTVMELGYMHKLGMWPQGGFTQWAEQFGLREVAPNTFSGGTSAAKLEKLRQQLIERGQWQTLYKDMEGVEGHVLMVPQTPEVIAGVRSIRAAFAMASKAFQKAGMSRYLTPTAGHEVIYLKRFIESRRLPQVIELARDAIAAGWKPIVFSEYRSGAETGMDFFHKLPGELGKRINAMLPNLPDFTVELRKAFGNQIGVFAGEANELRADELTQFMAGGKDALYMTYAAGGVGANAQDKVGDRPRMGIFMGLPWSGLMFEQATGRPWRYGTKSNVANVFLTSDTLPEMKVLATKILPRMRSLRAAVYGEKMESELSKNLRESVGIPEEMLQYEQGQEYKVDAAQFEEKGDGDKFTHFEDFEMPDAKRAMNKGMKYKGAGRKLHQGPIDDDDPFAKAALESWQNLLADTRKLAAPQAAAITANEPIIRMAAADAGRAAMGTGEPVEAAIRRTTEDMKNDALIWLDDLKDQGRAGSNFVKTSLWMFGTSGDRALEKVFRASGLKTEGAEMKRRMVDRDIRAGNYRGEFGGMVAKIIHENKLTAPEHELVTRIVEGKASAPDARLNKAANDYRRFFAYVRRRLADVGFVLPVYEDGKRKDIPYSKIDDDPNYWPRIYDWNKKMVIRDPQTGERTVTSLGKIMDMPTGDERRENLIDKVAARLGVSKLQAQAFFEKRQRGISLAGNIERSRQFDIPMYGRDRRAIERYVNEIAEKLADTEVHGQFREKTDGLISQLPNEASRKLADHIVTADLDPARLHDEDRWALRMANRGIVLLNMPLSFLKVVFHQAKGVLATNTRSVARALIQDIVHPREVYQNAVDAGAMVNYLRTAWMREYGMRTGGFDQKMLDFTGFTPLMYYTRMTSAAAGRLWLEKYAHPELVKDPKNPYLRRKLNDLYGYSDEMIDNLATNGIQPADVKRIALGAANWTTGSGRPSELPPAMRGALADNPLEQRLVTLIRIAQSLHGFMFKTANLVNRTVWQEVFHGDLKTAEPYKLIGRFAVNFGLAGLALNEMLNLRHKLSGSSEAEMEKHRREWLNEHPVSKEAIFYAMMDVSTGMGLEVASQFFEELATHDPKDRQKLAQQHRVLNAAGELIWGRAGDMIKDAAIGVWDYAETFRDTGHHRETPQERREKILKQLTTEEIAGARLIPYLRTKPAPPPTLTHRHSHRRRAASVLR